jgi:hypothetical protein
VVESPVFARIDVDSQLEIGAAVDMRFSWSEHRGGRSLEALNDGPPTPRLRLFKLHGSVSWPRCPLCGFVYVNTVGSVVQQAFREDKIDDDDTCVRRHVRVRARAGARGDRRPLDGPHDQGPGPPDDLAERARGAPRRRRVDHRGLLPAARGHRHPLDPHPRGGRARAQVF